MKTASLAIFLLAAGLLPPTFAESVVIRDDSICTASASLGDGFSPDLMFDGDTATCWAAAGSAGLKLIFLAEQPVGKLRIYGGYGKSKNLYLANNRLKKVRISLSALVGWKDDVTEIARRFSSVIPVWSGEAEFKDEMGWQETRIGTDKISQVQAIGKAVAGLPEEQREGAVKAFLITLEVTGVYRGSKYNDTCVSEIKQLPFDGPAGILSGIRQAAIERPGLITIPLNEDSSVEIIKTEDCYLFTTLGKNGRSCPEGGYPEEDSDFFASYLTPAKAGSFKSADGRSVFFAAEAESSGVREIMLSLFNPRSCSVLAVKLSFSNNLTHPFPHITFSTEYKKSGLEEEKALLLAAAEEYGYETPENPAKDISDRRYAWYLWKRENPSPGPLKLRWYQGAPDDNNSKEAEIQDGCVIYTAWFKGGVTQFDTSKNIFRPLYHPENPMAWPCSLLVWHDYLFIGTRGEGVTAINLKTLTLKNVQSEENAEKIEMRQGQLYINGKPVDFKKF